MNYRMNLIAIFVAALAVLCMTLSAGEAGAAEKTISGVVNINEASVSQLQLLPGIGLAKAKAIVDYRKKQSFSSPADLTKVKGIGKGLLKKIRDHVVVKGKTTARALQKKRSQRKK
jgi:competence protein ComEA